MSSGVPLGRIIIITGLSGSGKSTALNALEDSGFFCIDNLPVLLLPKFLALRAETGREILKLAVGMDIRGRQFVSQFKEVFQQVQSMEYDLTVVFLEASDETLVKRYSETRRRHPLDAEYGGLLEAIRHERELMAPLREAANHVLDTTTYHGREFRELFTQRFAQAEIGQKMSIEVLSFGFKRGLPPEADILMDVRFLPNPFYLDDLRELDGRDQRVVDYVLANKESRDFVEKFCKLLEFIIPMYQREGRSYLVIAIGCTGGHHRSVTVVNKVADRLRILSNNLTVRHRDIGDREES